MPSDLKGDRLSDEELAVIALSIWEILLRRWDPEDHPEYHKSAREFITLILQFTDFFASNPEEATRVFQKHQEDLGAESTMY